MSLMKWFESREQGVIIVSLGYGDLLLESLRQVAVRGRYPYRRAHDRAGEPDAAAASTGS